MHDEEGGLVQKQHLGNLLRFVTVEGGTVSESLHIQTCEDLATKRRAAVAAASAPQPICRRAENT